MNVTKSIKSLKSRFRGIQVVARRNRKGKKVLRVVRVKGGGAPGRAKARQG